MSQGLRELQNAVSQTRHDVYRVDGVDVAQEIERNEAAARHS